MRPVAASKNTSSPIIKYRVYLYRSRCEYIYIATAVKLVEVVMLQPRITMQELDEANRVAMEKIRQLSAQYKLGDVAEVMRQEAKHFNQQLSALRPLPTPYELVETLKTFWGIIDQRVEDWKSASKILKWLSVRHIRRVDLLNMSKRELNLSVKRWIKDGLTWE